MKHSHLLFFIMSIVSLCSAQVSKHFIAQYLPENPIVIDAGAYDGADSVEMSRLWPQAKIYSFEPVPNLFARLKNNTAHCANITCVQKALGEKVGTQTMFISNGGDQSSSLLAPDQQLYNHFPHITFPYEIAVETTTLDKFAQEQGLDHVDLLWFDLQGMEPMVLAASPKMLATVKAVYAEVSYSPLYKDAPLYAEFRAWMDTQGFVVVKEFYHHPTFGDALFIRKN